jgi:hypothetical protein
MERRLQREAGMSGGSKHNSPACARPVLLIAVGAMVVIALGVAACTDLSTTTSTAASEATETTSAVTSTAPGVTDATGTTGANPVSQESRDYAASLGGTSHQGEKLYFVIGASLGSEAQAKALLEPAKAVGDMQSNFIVQLSDNFDGMAPGYWVIFEAYDGYPSVEDLEFCRRPFPHAYVKKATVLTEDPIPVRPGG